MFFFLFFRCWMCTGDQDSHSQRSAVIIFQGQGKKILHFSQDYVAVNELCMCNLMKCLKCNFKKLITHYTETKLSVKSWRNMIVRALKISMIFSLHTCDKSLTLCYYIFVHFCIILHELIICFVGKLSHSHSGVEV